MFLTPSLEKTLLEIIRVAEITNSLAEVARAAGLDPARDFMRADLSEIDFNGIDMSGVDIRNAKVDGASFDGAINAPSIINPHIEDKSDRVLLPTHTLREMMTAGVHFGHYRKYRHPRMAQFIFEVRGGIDIIDIRITRTALAEGLEYLSNVAQSNGSILFVSRKDKLKEKIREAAVQCGAHYVNDRWLGGFLTNWQTIHPQILKHRANRENGLLGTTKKELLLKRRAFEKAERKYGGVVNLAAPPDVVVSLDAVLDEIAIKEAKSTGAKVIAVADSNAAKLDNVDILIPGNTVALRSNLFYAQAFSAAVNHGRLQAA